MKGQPAREGEAYFAKLKQYDGPLQILYFGCFVIVLGGSLYGMHEMLLSHAQTSSVWTWLGAFLFSAIVQSLNMVAVTFSMRMVAAAFSDKWRRLNTHQTFGGIDIGIGIGGLCITLGLSWLDYSTNQIGNHHAAEAAVSKPQQTVVDTSSHASAVKMASMAVHAEKNAERAERQAFESAIDNQINAEKNRLTKRYNHLAALAGRPQWAANEMKQIDRTLRNLEAQRTARKREFVPKKSDVASRERELAATSSQQSQLLMTSVAVADSVHAVETLEYLSLKGHLKSGFMWAYLLALLMMHFVDFVYWWLAYRYDVKEDDAGDSLLQSYKETIADLLKNLAWWGLTFFAWLKPERPVQRHGRTKVAEMVAQNPYCADVLGLVLNHPGINEMSIYMKMRETLQASLQTAPAQQSGLKNFFQKSPTAVTEFQRALSALTECGLVSKSNGRFMVNPDQAAHFYDLKRMKNPQHFSASNTFFQGESGNFGGETSSKKAAVLRMIEALELSKPFSASPEKVDQMIAALVLSLDFV